MRPLSPPPRLPADAIVPHHKCLACSNTFDNQTYVMLQQYFNVARRYTEQFQVRLVCAHHIAATAVYFRNESNEVAKICTAATPPMTPGTRARIPGARARVCMYAYVSCLVSSTPGFTARANTSDALSKADSTGADTLTPESRNVPAPCCIDVHIQRCRKNLLSFSVAEVMHDFGLDMSILSSAFGTGATHTLGWQRTRCEWSLAVLSGASAVQNLAEWTVIVFAFLRDSSLAVVSYIVNMVVAVTVFFLVLYNLLKSEKNPVGLLCHLLPFPQDDQV